MANSPEIAIETNTAEVIARFKAKAEAVERASRSIVVKGSAVIEAEAKQGFRPRPAGTQRTSKNGRVWFDTRGTAAPQPPIPTQRTGNLRNSIKRIEVRRIGPGAWLSTTGPTMIYGRRVELGGGPARAFPYMEPAVQRATPELQRIYREEWAKALET